MKYTPTYSEFYYGISLNHYQQFKEAYEEILKLSDGHGNIQMLDITPEEQNKYYWYEQIQRQALMICILFQAFAIESFVNMVAVNLYGEEMFFGNDSVKGFERMGTEKKINKIFSEKLNSDFKKNHTEVKELVDLTFDLRDVLAHYKSGRIDLVAMQEDPLENMYHPLQDLIEHYNKIDVVVTAYEKFKNLVNGLLGYDIFNKQMEYLQESIAFNISEIFRKGLGL